MHNLDTCEVTVLGEELNQEQESLEIDMTRLQQKGIEMSSSNLGMIITGRGYYFWFFCRKGLKTVIMGTACWRGGLSHLTPNTSFLTRMSSLEVLQLFCGKL